MTQVQVSTPEHMTKLKRTRHSIIAKARHRKIKSLGRALRSKMSRNKIFAEQGADKMKRRKIE